ncbi:hypothetical protein NliqN6_5147 [Naganishia liquefaciens]|uniref:Uncharacterized protein n=1 Tax=Naganishia liquefaciens TaxID=104408 RepID=A0A8H3TWY7_9TREE|nr:hypothetical protein NliqN6_5147 [Naganishia liquefaciens]
MYLPAAQLYGPVQTRGAMQPYVPFRHLQQPYPQQPGYSTAQRFETHTHLRPLYVQDRGQAPYQSNLRHDQMPVDIAQPGCGPAPQVAGWLPPVNAAELQVAGILPYSYGFPRYGQHAFRPEGGDMNNKLNPYGRGFPYGFYKTVL